MKQRTPLQQAAFCALADLVYLWEDDPSVFINPMIDTYLELYEALKDEGHDVSDYEELQKMFLADKKLLKDVDGI